MAKLKKVVSRREKLKAIKPVKERKDYKRAVGMGRYYNPPMRLSKKGKYSIGD